MWRDVTIRQALVDQHWRGHFQMCSCVLFSLNFACIAPLSAATTIEVVIFLCLDYQGISELWKCGVVLWNNTERNGHFCQVSVWRCCSIFDLNLPWTFACLRQNWENISGSRPKHWNRRSPFIFHAFISGFRPLTGHQNSVGKNDRRCKVNQKVRHLVFV